MLRRIHEEFALLVRQGQAHLVSKKGRMVDALASGGDEGRRSLR